MSHLTFKYTKCTQQCPLTQKTPSTMQWWGCEKEELWVFPQMKMFMLGHSNSSPSPLSGEPPMPGKEYKREYLMRSKYLLFISHLSMCFLHLQSAWFPSAFHNPRPERDGAADRRAAGFHSFCLDQALWVLPDRVSSSLLKYRNFTPVGNFLCHSYTPWAFILQDFFPSKLWNTSNFYKPFS